MKTSCSLHFLHVDEFVLGCENSFRGGRVDLGLAQKCHIAYTSSAPQQWRRSSGTWIFTTETGHWITHTIRLHVTKNSTQLYMPRYLLISRYSAHTRVSQNRPHPTLRPIAARRFISPQNKNDSTFILVGFETGLDELYWTSGDVKGNARGQFWISKSPPKIQILIYIKLH